MPAVSARGGPKTLIFQTVLSAEAALVAPNATASATPIRPAMETGQTVMVFLPAAYSAARNGAGGQRNDAASCLA